jgi:hypothetical protein
MLNGAHAIIYSKQPDIDRAFFRDVLNLPNVDVGGGWLIFGMPPAEIAVHPAEHGGGQEIYLMCDDIRSFVEEMTRRSIPCEPVRDHGWGLLTYLTFPGGGKLGVYEPRHARPPTPLAIPPKKAKKRRKKTPRPATTRRGKKKPRRR